jgi:hypothetical protein
LNDTEDITPREGQQRIPVVALIAIVLSLCALLVSVLEVSAIRSEQRVGVWPYLDISSSYNEEGFRIVATNKGIGPARVRASSMVLDEQPQEDLDTMIKTILGPERAFSYDVYKSSNPAGGVMSPDESNTLFAVPWTDATRDLVEALTGRFSIELCYCSVYDDCWLARLNEGEPEEVSQCR